MSTLLISSLVSGVLAGGLCGSIGVICNRLKLTTIAFSMAHAALAGSALALAVNADLISLAMVFAFLTATILGPLADQLRISLDLVSMILFSIYNALTFIFIIMAPGPTLMTESIGQLLWGSILAIRFSYIAYLTAAAAISISFITIFWGRIGSLLFDPRLAEAEGMNVRLYKYAILILAGAIITLALRITGGFLVFSLLYLPAAASLQFQSTMRRMIASSWILGSASASIGLGISFLLDLPAGSCITIAAVILFAAAVIYSKLKTSTVFRREALCA